MGLSQPRSGCPEQSWAEHQGWEASRETRPKGFWRADHLDKSPCEAWEMGWSNHSSKGYLFSVYWELPWRSSQQRDATGSILSHVLWRRRKWGDESPNRENRLCLKIWPRNSKKSKSVHWEWGGLEEVRANSWASLAFALQTLFQKSLRLRSSFNAQQKVPKPAVPSLPPLTKADTLQMWKKENRDRPWLLQDFGGKIIAFDLNRVETTSKGKRTLPGTNSLRKKEWNYKYRKRINWSGKVILWIPRLVETELKFRTLVKKRHQRMNLKNWCKN